MKRTKKRNKKTRKVELKKLWQKRVIGQISKKLAPHVLREHANRKASPFRVASVVQRGRELIKKCVSINYSINRRSFYEKERAKMSRNAKGATFMVRPTLYRNRARRDIWQKCKPVDKAETISSAHLPVLSCWSGHRNVRALILPQIT